MKTIEDIVLSTIDDVAVIADTATVEDDLIEYLENMPDPTWFERLKSFIGF